MNDLPDPLWNPQQPGDDELQHLQNLLAPYSAGARGLNAPPPLAHPGTQRRRHWQRLLVASAAVLIAGVALAGYLGWRLDWREGQAWTVRADAAEPTRIAPGQWLHTDSGQLLDIEVARIGRLAVSPDSSLRLLETRRGHHRLALEHGHLRARIWAPPGWFGISSGEAELIDLGCDFDIWKQSDGSGRVLVRSGWVAYEIGAEEILVPAGYQMRFEADRAYTPLRPEADREFQSTMIALDLALRESVAISANVESSAARLAELGDERDGFSLLSLLTRYPALARTALYPRLMQSQRLVASEAHRRAWIAGDVAAINQGWSTLPRQPKAWWWNWADGY
jgi:hypothetical protein